jgi:hypothetical protein
VWDEIGLGWWIMNMQVEVERLIRQWISADLTALGLSIRTVERGGKLEEVGKGYVPGSRDKGSSLGLLEIQGSPIRWLNILEHKYGSSLHHKRPAYLNIYLVPDPDIAKNRCKNVESFPVRSKKFFGRVVRIRWKGECVEGGDLIERLNSDLRLSDLLVDLGEQLVISQELDFWVIKPKYPYVEPWLPRQPSFWGRQTSQKQWDCYCAIAQQLLELTS